MKKIIFALYLIIGVLVGGTAGIIVGTLFNDTHSSHGYIHRHDHTNGLRHYTEALVYGLGGAIIGLALSYKLATPRAVVKCKGCGRYMGYNPDRDQAPEKCITCIMQHKK